jgi:hypothetical protein
VWPSVPANAVGARDWISRLNTLPVLAATVLAIESLVFIWVHVKYHEVGSMIFSAALGLLMAFIAYGRLVLKRVPA